MSRVAQKPRREGFDRRRWAVDCDPSGNSVTFSLTSPDGDEGFPGTLQVRTTYTLTDDQRVRIDMRATTDRPTLCNLTQHSYFNLDGVADARDRASAHKLLAFITCTSDRLADCATEFAAARAADPLFQLSRSETGHPVWGPVYRRTLAP